MGNTVTGSTNKTGALEIQYVQVHTYLQHFSLTLSALKFSSNIIMSYIVGIFLQSSQSSSLAIDCGDVVMWWCLRQVCSR